MNIKGLLGCFVLTFAAAFLANAAVVYAWNAVRHGEGAFEWGTSFVLAITIGSAVTFVDAWRRRPTDQDSLEATK
jgi:hypothetical protein